MTRRYQPLIPKSPPYTFMDWFCIGFVAVIGIVCSLVLFGLFLLTAANATWKPEYAQLPQSTQDWYRAQTLTPSAQKRFAFVSCCDHADVVHTKFKAGISDEWFWLDENNKWQLVPPDIIHWNTPTPDGQAVMFAVSGEPVCFFPPTGGI